MPARYRIGGMNTNGASASASTAFHRPAFLWVLYLALAVFAFMQNMLGPMVPYLRDEFGFSYTLAGMHQSAFAVGMIVTGLMGHRILKRFGIAPTLWGGLSLMLVGLLLMVLAKSAVLTLGGVLVMAIAGTASLTAIQTSLSTSFAERRAVVLMEANLGASIATMLVPLVLLAGGAWLLGWRIVLPIMVLCVLALAGFGIPTSRRHLAARDQAADSGGGKLSPAYVRMWFLVFLGVSVEWSISFWCMSYLLGLPGGSREVAALGTLLLGFSAVAGRFVSSRIGARLSEERLLVIIMVLILVGFPAYWLRLNVPLTFVGLFLCGFGASTFYPLALSMAVGHAPGNTAKASAGVTIAAGLAIGGAPLVLGGVADLVGMAAALWYVPFGIALIFVLLALDRRSRTAH